MTETRILGSLRSIGDRTGTVRVEDVYDTDAAGLWGALTERARLARWIAVVDGDLELAGIVHTTFTSGWTGPGRVDVCEPQRRLVVTMNPGTDDETVIEAVLSAEAERTRLVVEERGIPLAEIAAHGAGWQAHIEDLASHLAGRDAGDWAARWAELAPHYDRLDTPLA